MRNLRGLLALAALALGVPAATLACRGAAAPPSGSPPGASSAANASSGAPAASSPDGASASSERARARDADAAAPGPASAPTPIPDEPPPPPEPEPPKPISAKACKAIVERSKGGFQRALSASKSACKADTDCTSVRATCLPGCGGTAIALADEARYEKMAAAANEECKRFWNGMCAVSLALPIPSCPAYQPRCLHGTCAVVQR